jgi:hypothetical protein
MQLQHWAAASRLAMQQQRKQGTASRSLQFQAARVRASAEQYARAHSQEVQMRLQRQQQLAQQACPASAVRQLQELAQQQAAQQLQLLVRPATDAAHLHLQQQEQRARALQQHSQLAALAAAVQMVLS